MIHTRKKQITEKQFIEMFSLSNVSHMHLARALLAIFTLICHKLLDVMKKFA